MIPVEVHRLVEGFIVGPEHFNALGGHDPLRVGKGGTGAEGGDLIV